MAMTATNLARHAERDIVVETAAQLLLQMPEPRNPFGSDGGLEDAVAMLALHGEDHRRGVVSALARISRQKGLTNGDEPFVWSEEDCTHHLDERLCSEMCARLASDLT